MGSWGLWKKIKNATAKAWNWVKNKFKKGSQVLADTVPKVLPVLKKVDFSMIDPKLGQIQKKVIALSDDIAPLNEKIQNEDFKGVVEYGKNKFIPKFKNV